MKMNPTVVLLLALTACVMCKAAPPISAHVPHAVNAALVDENWLYLFVDDEIVQVSLKYKSEGRRVNSTSVWPGLDASNWDAAVNDSADGSIYFFKGTTYNLLKENVLTGPREIPADWPDVFRNGGVDAAGSRQGRSYLFKGCSLWTPCETSSSDGHLIHDLNTLNLPCDVDSVWEDGNDLIILKGINYWTWGDSVKGPFAITRLLDLCTLDYSDLSTSSPLASLPNPLVCNGDTRLCSLPLDKVTLPGSHNAGSGFTGPFISPPCFYQNHDLSILEQLRFGIRYLDVDTCWTACGNSLGTCHAGHCAGPICSLLVQIKTFLIQNPTEIVVVNFNRDMVDHNLTIPELVRQIENQLSPFLNNHFRMTGEWPTLEEAIRTGKRLFVIINSEVTKMSFYSQKLWITDDANMARTYSEVPVFFECSNVVLTTMDKCKNLSSEPLIEVSVFGGFGACNDDKMAMCDKFLFKSLEVCSDYRINASRAPNVLLVDYPRFAPPHRNVLAAVRQQNARNLLAFGKNCRLKLDAATSLDVDRDTVFFSGNRILRYSDKDKAQKSSELISSVSPSLPANIDSAISGRYWGDYDHTYFFKGCNYWVYGNGSSKGPFVINDTFHGLGCDIDAAVGIDNTAYFLKGCYFWTYKRGLTVYGPIPISCDFEGLPCNIDAALNIDDKVYFFQNNNNNGLGTYWMFHDRKITQRTSILDWDIDPVVCDN